VLTVAFIVASTVVYLAVGTAPVALLVFAGAFNGLILPIGIAVLLWVAWRRRDLLHGYRYPRGLVTFGVVAWAVAVYLAWESLARLRGLLG
jgi:Mn2+/Fe2+ NRAMP family transporter